ncbi:MAG: hypothetical protein L6R40_000268 [Gallowayella cf. fulva]|nr:MAG: hypothetical protein L6R40_000268 [Xanthomendoza cf. fulva]
MAPKSLLLPILHILALVCLAAGYSTLSDKSLRALPSPGDDFNIKTGKLLSPILQPRVPGTPGSILVQNHFIDFFKTALPKWKIELQNSTSKTPATGDKEIPFVNVIVSRDPPWTTPGFSSRLTLVAHYDSLSIPEGFIGATDSAAPCAILMHAARSIDAALTTKWEKLQADGEDSEFEDQQGIQIFFLDGEEAFQTWTATDSVYGARSLAAEMESTAFAAQSTFHNAISTISLFVLLDLLGAKNPVVPSYFKTTHWAYKKMASLEKRLRSLSLFESSPKKPSPKKPSPKKVSSKKAPSNKPSSKKARSNKAPSRKASKRDDTVFLPDFDKTGDRWLGGMIGDDHVPFMERGVEVLHIIPTPFPRVWHNREDDGAHLDLPTVADWSRLITAFTAEWMELEGFMNLNQTAPNHSRETASEGPAQAVDKSEL